VLAREIERKTVKNKIMKKTEQVDRWRYLDEAMVASSARPSAAENDWTYGRP